MGAKPSRRSLEKRPFNARRRQMTGTHVRAQLTYQHQTRSRIRKKARLALFSPVYYSAAVASRYLKSGMSNADPWPGWRRRMSRASLTAGFYCYSGRPTVFAIRPDSTFALRFIPLRSAFNGAGRGRVSGS